MKGFKSGLLCFLPTIIMLLFWKYLPMNIAIHFNFYGNADSFMNTYYFIILIPFIGFVGHIFYISLLEKRPEWFHKRIHKTSYFYIPCLTWLSIGIMVWNS